MADYHMADGALDVIADIGAAREKHGENKNIKSKVIYNSLHFRSSYWYAVSWMYCGCCEPTYLITDQVIKGYVWQGCYLVSDVMAWEQVTNISRNQSCYDACMHACMPCCCNDKATITVIGDDDTHPDGWELPKIKNSLEVYREMNRILTDHGGKVQKKKSDKKKGYAKSLESAVVYVL